MSNPQKSNDSNIKETGEASILDAMLADPQPLPLPDPIRERMLAREGSIGRKSRKLRDIRACKGMSMLDIAKLASIRTVSHKDTPEGSTGLPKGLQAALAQLTGGLVIQPTRDQPDLAQATPNPNPLTDSPADLAGIIVGDKVTYTSRAGYTRQYPVTRIGKAGYKVQLTGSRGPFWVRVDRLGPRKISSKARANPPARAYNNGDQAVLRSGKTVTVLRRGKRCYRIRVRFPSGTVQWIDASRVVRYLSDDSGICPGDNQCRTRGLRKGPNCS